MRKKQVGMSRMKKRVSQLEKENVALKHMVAAPAALPANISSEQLMHLYVKLQEMYMKQQETIAELKEQLQELNGALAQSNAVYEYDTQPTEEFVTANDKRILEFIQMQPHAMAAAEDVRKFMNYKGRNAACARLCRLEEHGHLDKVRVGRKIYYKIDAGKTTNKLIIAPPQ